MEFPVRKPKPKRLSIRAGERFEKHNNPDTLNRRNALRLLGLTAVATQLGIMKYDSNQWWQSGDTVLRIVDKGTNPKSRILGVAFGGEGVADPTDDTTVWLAKAAAHRIPMASMITSERNGVKLSDMVANLRKAKDSLGFEYVFVYGQSIGGDTGPVTALEANIPMAGLAVSGSPMGLGTARYATGAKLAASRFNISPLHTPELMLADYLDYIRVHGYPNFIGSVLFGDELQVEWNQLPREGSPKLRYDGLGIVEANNLISLTHEFAAGGIITSETPGAYIRTRRLSEDTVVYELPSIAGFVHMFNDLHAHMNVYDMMSHRQEHAYGYGSALTLARTGWLGNMIDNIDGPLQVAV